MAAWSGRPWPAVAVLLHPARHAGRDPRGRMAALRPPKRCTATSWRRCRGARDAIGDASPRRAVACRRADPAGHPPALRRRHLPRRQLRRRIPPDHRRGHFHGDAIRLAAGQQLAGVDVCDRSAREAAAKRYSAAWLQAVFDAHPCRRGLRRDRAQPGRRAGDRSSGRPSAGHSATWSGAQRQDQGAGQCFSLNFGFGSSLCGNALIW